MEQYGTITPKMARIMKELTQAERERVLSAPDSDIPTERCIDGRYISITEKKLAYRALDELSAEIASSL